MPPRIYSVTEDQLQALSSLYRLVSIISDGLGSEATNDGQVLTTTETTFAAARRAFFPPNYNFVPLTSSGFRRDYGTVKGVRELLSFCAPLRPEFGLTGSPDEFNPDGDPLGGFWICLFLKGKKVLGQNALVRFERAET